MPATFGQVMPATGTPPFNSYGGGPFDTVNLGNLNYHFAIPVLSRPGRGISFYYNFTYDSSIYTKGSSGWTPVGGWGWQSQTDAATGYLPAPTVTYNNTTCNGKPFVETIYSFPGFVDPLGTYHHTVALGWFAQCGGPVGSTITSDDGSGYTVTITSPSTGYITSSKGKVWNVPVAGSRAGAANVTDANGNQISTSNGVTFYDTLSTSTPVLAISGTNPVSYTYTAQSGSVAVKLYYSSYNIQTAFGCSGIGEYSATGVSLVNKIGMPDGSQYLFNYETNGSNYTGRLSSITLPTGGTIAYTYTGGNDGIECSDGSTSGLTRTLTPGGEWQYSRSGSGTSWTTTVNSPPDPQNLGSADDITVINFAEDSASITPSENFYETQRKIYQGAASGTPLESVVTCYNGNTTSCATAAVASPIREVNAYTQLNGSSQARVDTFYSATYQLPTEIDRYDFGGSSPLQSTFITYANPGPGIVGDPACVQVTAGTHPSPCGTITSDTVSATTYSNYDSHGNVQTIKRWVSGISGPTWLTQAFTYYSGGLVETATDVNGAQTTYTYGNCNNSLLTSVSEPLSLSRSMTWDCNGGVPSTTTDENGNVTSYDHYDSMWRNTDTMYPDGGETQTAYYISNSPSYLQVKQLISSGSWVTNQTNLDGLGRPVLSANLSDPNGYNYRATSYNNMGQVYTVSNPYYSTSDPTYGLTTYTYDALGRVESVVPPVSNDSTTVSYNQRAREVTHAGVSRVYQADGLGRTVNVCEVTNASPAGGPSPSACGLDITPSPNDGFLSGLNYDALGRVISFCAGAAQCRTFAYDGLSRLTSESYPEVGNNVHTTNGTVSYTYDTLHAGDLYQRTAPLQNQTGTSTVVTTYTYDLLHRPLNVSYNDGVTLARGWAYDLSSYWGNTLFNGKGRLSYQSTSLGGGTADVIYGYDPMGRVNLYGQCSPQNCTASTPNHFVVSYSYNLLGEVKGDSDFITGGTYWTNTYDAIGRLQSVWTSYLTNTTSGNLISNMTYNALGERTGDTLANGLAESWSYDTEGRATAYSAGSLYSYSGLTYTPNLISSSDTFNGNYSYTYDALGRLATAGNGTNNFSYGYDRWGNRWNQTVTKGSGPQPSYSFNSNNQSGSFTYDAAGNITNDGAHTYTYDAEGRIMTVDGGSTNTYVYNSRGMRAGLMGGENLFDLSGNIVSVVTPGTTTLLYNRYTVGGRLLAANNSNTTNFYHQDWLGGIRALSSLSGSLLSSCTSLPFGDGTNCGLWYYGELMHDSWDNLNTSATRSESPTSGRWLTPDPGGVAVMDRTNPQTWNRYAYVTNNPVSYVDPSGLFLKHGGGGGCDIDEYNCFGGGGTGDNSSGGGGGGGGFCDASGNCGGGNGIVGGGNNGIFNSFLGPFWGAGPGYNMGSISGAGNLLSAEAGYLSSSDTEYYLTDANGNVISTQKALAAITFGQLACGGMDDSEVASCILQTYNSMGDPVYSEGGHDNFDWSQISITINGESVDTNPADFGCLLGRCGIFDSLDFSHPGTNFHVDMANVYFFPVGTLLHTVADLWGGHSWWSGGVPPFPFPIP